MKTDETIPRPRFTILYDGACPLCVREMAWLKKRDTSGNLGTIDIATPEFSPGSVRPDLTLDTLMARIHGLDTEGNLVEGMEVFRQAYAAAGLGWLMAPTGWPVLRPIFDLGYRGFAKIRVPLGRLLGRSCPDGACTRP